MKYFNRLGVILCLALVWQVVPNLDTFAQNCNLEGSITLDVQLAPILSESQVLSLTALGIDNRGSGPQLVTGSMKNETDELLENLYFEFRVSATQVGVIAELVQQAAFPFSLDPQQFVYGTNNNVDSEQLPGVEEEFKFDGGLTPEGEQFIEDLGGTTALPTDVYTVYTSISQVTNECGRVILAEKTVSVGGNETGVILDELSISLRTPGTEIGTIFSISNPYPQLSWEGDASRDYRVIVVAKDGDRDIQTMINDAEGSPPLLDGGDLITPFEYLDVNVTGNSLQYPTAGAQALITGQTYYWQVSTQVNSTTGIEDFVSDIWTFTLIDPSDASSAAAQEIDEETIQAIIALIGADLYTTLSEDGFFFESIELDNQSFSGITGFQKLAEIFGLINDGDIILNDN